MPPHTSADTPVMRQFLEVKSRYPDCIVFFRLGDFYEMFFEDAHVASRLLDLALTTRDKNKEEGVPMCGVPHHAARFYIGKLIEAGKKVAICDQVEDARLAKGIVRRDVTQVITPGVVLEEEQLQPKSGHYLAAIAPGTGPATGRCGVAYLDVSTGEFAATQLRAENAVEELCRIEPREVLVVGGAALLPELPRRLRAPLSDSTAVEPAVDLATLREVLGAALDDLEGHRPAGARLSDWGMAQAAAAACVRYARAAQPAGTLPLVRLCLYDYGDELVLDESAKNNLELFQTSMERKQKGSLLSVLDSTCTAMGGRLLRRWLGAPLRRVAEIRARHDAVGWLVERHALRTELRKELAEIHDLERLTGRLTLGVATPQDLSRLRKGLGGAPQLQRAIAAVLAQETEALGLSLPPLLDLGGDVCADVEARIAAALVEDPPAAFRDGGFIRRGLSTELDELMDISKNGKEHLLRIEERERERSGISSLKIRYNKVFGYYFEITRSNLSRVPADFIRKQTLTNAERFVTAELSDYEAKILGAEERMVELELALFAALCRDLCAHAARLLDLAARLARLDALCALGEVAHRNGYTRPEVDDGVRLCIEDGRHPVVEQLAASGGFVPNDVTLDPDEEQLLIITGPNMAGKSTIMRQVALISVMAQMGSFVPARAARLGVVDRVFTRVGAADNLARGESTFMVEMRETAHILAHATRRSLVILDEIGRGTSTYDGVSIAWAVAEHLHDVIGCKTLFATHYHELCALADSRARVRNHSIAVREWQGEIVFLHRLVAGGANRSYGIEVARLAGLPQAVLGRSREILALLEAGEGQAAGMPVHVVPQSPQQQLALFAALGASAVTGGRRRGRGDAVAAGGAGAGGAAGVSAGSAPAAPAPTPAGPERVVLERMRQLDCDGITPREALHLISDLCAQLRR